MSIYCVDDPDNRVSEYTLGIYTSSTDRPCDPEQSQCSDRADEAKTVKHQLTAIQDHDIIVSTVVERLTSWNRAKLWPESLIIEAVDEDDTLWLTRVCNQLDDGSVHLGRLSINLNTTLPLHLLLDKLACCNTVHLYFSTQNGRLPVVTDANLHMLHQLSECLTSPHIQYIEVECHDNNELRTTQWNKLLQHAASFTVRVTSDDINMAAALAAARCRSVHISVSSQQQLEQKAQYLRILSGSLTALELDIGFSLNETTLQMLSQTIQSLPTLHSLRLSIKYDGVHSHDRVTKPVIVQLLSLGSYATALDSLHISVRPYVFKADERDVGMDSLKLHIASALKTWKSSIVDGSVTVLLNRDERRDMESAAYNIAKQYKRLFRELDDHLDTHRIAVTQTLEQLMTAYHTSEKHIANKVLHYVHDCYND